MKTKLHAQLRARIKNLDSISTAPAILMPLFEMLRLPSEKISIEKVVELVSYDGAIAAQVLRRRILLSLDAARSKRCAPPYWALASKEYGPCYSVYA